MKNETEVWSFERKKDYSDKRVSCHNKKTKRQGMKHIQNWIATVSGLYGLGKDISLLHIKIGSLIILPHIQIALR